MPRNKNVIVGFIYRHHNMQRNEINNCFLFELSTKLSKEPKEDILLILLLLLVLLVVVVLLLLLLLLLPLLRDCNIGLLKSDENSDLVNFLHIMFSNSFLPQITSPTRIRPRSRTLIGNISSKDPADNLIAGNIVTSISVHLARFLILPNRKFQKVTKTVVYQINFTKMNKKSFLNDLKNLNWETSLIITKEDVNHSFRKFLKIVETLLDTYAPVSPFYKADQKRKLKPWIKKGLLTSI